MKTSRIWQTAAAALCGLVLLSSCASEGAPQDDAAPASGLETIRVGVLRSVADAPFVLGDENGIFEKHGLDIELEKFNGGAAMVPAALSGSIDIGDGNLLSVAIGAEQNVPVQVLTSSFIVDSDPTADMSSIVASTDSSIESAADLAGKTVAINALASISELAVRDAVEAAGADPESVQFVEIAFPEIPAAVETGNVDAGFLVTPFLELNADKLKPIAHPYSELYAGEAVGGYFAASGWLAEHPQTAEKFIAAMAEAAEYTNAHTDEARASLPGYLDLPEAVVSEMPIPVFGGGLVEMPKIAGSAKRYGILTDGPDYSTLYWKG
ncbi:ABC transporter substrate-binding protein [Leucobacter sp. gxy201]|uniref:ABC transporter substrate-binding protein n=1 Tax=Leucobacter sp. gxy201 TaxID=2957200 RepID=UPI003DA01169